MRCVIYTRLSVDRDGTELGVDRQREDCERLALARGWHVAEIVTENDTAATRAGTRPGFARVVDMLRSRAADAVVSWDMSRLARNARDTLAVLEVGEDVGATLAFVQGSDLTLATPAGRMTASILAAVARNETDVKAARQRAAVAQAARQGRRVGGRRPFGFEPDGVTERESEAQAVRDGYADVLAGVPLAAVARSWNDRGLTTGQPRRDGSPSPWSHVSVRDVLLNPRYAGIRAVGAWRTERDERGNLRKIGRRTWEEVGPAVWPALVTEETYRAAVATLTAPGRASGAGPRRLLTGVATCGECGGRIHAGGKARTAPAGYRCAERGCFARRAEPVDEYVREVILARLRRDDARALLALAAAASTTPGAAPAGERAAAARQTLDALASDYGGGIITRAEFLAARGPALDRLKAAEREMSASAGTSALTPLLAADDVAAAFDAADVDRRRAVVAALVEVTVRAPGRGTRRFDPASVEIVWREW